MPASLFSFLYTLLLPSTYYTLLQHQVCSSNRQRLCTCLLLLALTNHSVPAPIVTVSIGLQILVYHLISLMSKYP
ncbi:MAG: hypothetical protein JOS17DRAFT_733862 [Linnemannia elongata]|nr:MAG: hypothetical protein JOS17DRAFT_733862 [Linnemannia elongata]